MNTKSLVSMALLVGIGAVLHAVVPGILFIKPDLMLTMMFLAIILFPQMKNVIVLGIVTGIISGLTTTFPGGFIPNVIDKFVTAIVFYLLLVLLKKIHFSIKTIGFLTVIGTLISGTVFLGSAYMIADLPKSFFALFASAVLPAMVINAILMVIIYPIVTAILKKSNVPIEA
ncbi:tryptophan transporter [Bacillus massiliigorillae]|uniref:tryptophan transporter n=1 Tax=Bacillus massiliigorillae TaxID=1243664 RepID=UPI00039EF715|nr:tryptophan transporter [Bacillus massiliigorillae]